jgi:cytochrome c oxidase cbb3-type subunit I/II
MDAAGNHPPLPRTEDALVRAHGTAAMVMLVVSVLFGITVSLKFHIPELLGGDAWSTWGRLRYNHTQGIFFGWLGNAFLAFLYFAVPRLADRPVLSRSLGWAIFVIWNFAVVVPGWVLVMAGFSQPLEWAEFPLVVDAFVVLALALMVIQFVTPFLRVRTSELFVSSWYIMGALVFTLLAYPVGNLAPELLPGTLGAAFSGLWIHDAIGLYVTPLALAIAYYVIPGVTRRPIYSHFYSMVGFWLLFFVYPLNGTHHYVMSSLPMSAQKSAIAASMFLGMDVVLVVTNLLLSLRGAAAMTARDVPLRFVWTGIIFYLLVSLQGSMQASMTLNRLTHFSDWVVGHSHLAMLGFATFTAAGGLAYAWQRTPGTRYNPRLMNWSYWLLLTGVLLMVADLTTVGLIEAHLWRASLPWLASVDAAQKFWVFRTFAAIPVVAGFLVFWAGLFSGPRTSGYPVAPAHDEVAAADAHTSLRDGESIALTTGIGALRMGYLATFVAGIGFFALSFVVLAVIPGMQVRREIARAAPSTMQPLTAQQEWGRRIYGSMGCGYCHTQQVRFADQDVARFGAPTEAWETKYDYPQLWGTRRIGPDLAREGAIRSADWQLTHLFNPRLTVARSMMPGFPWMYDGTPDKPKPQALALAAYIQWLGQARAQSGFDARRPPRPVGGDASSHMTARASQPPMGNANASRARQTGNAPTFAPASAPVQREIDRRRGRDLFAANCASCHGERGAGDGPGALALLPRPANLLAHRYADQRVSVALWNGVTGSAMPAWRDRRPEDLRDVATYVQSLSTKQNDTTGPAATDSSPVDEARTLFAQHCASCHGDDGAGDGPAAAALNRTPTNFHIQQPSIDYARRALSEGVAGSAMPPWEHQLTEPQRQQLVDYVRSLFQTPEFRGDEGLAAAERRSR